MKCIKRIVQVCLFIIFFSVNLQSNLAEHLNIQNLRILVGSEKLNSKVDDIGNTYLTGLTESKNLPILNAFQTMKRGQSDVFVTLNRRSALFQGKAFGN